MWNNGVYAISNTESNHYATAANMYAFSRMPQVLDAVQSYVSLRVPLYVSYIYHSPVGSGWQHFDQQTELKMTFVYDTAILWDKGIGTPPEAELQGKKRHALLSVHLVRFKCWRRRKSANVEKK